MRIGWFAIIPLFQYVSHVSSKILGSSLDPDALDLLRKTNMEQFILHLGIPNTGLCHAPEDDEDLQPMFNEDEDFSSVILYAALTQSEENPTQKSICDLAFGDMLMDEKPEDDEEKIEGDTDNVAQDFSSDGSSTGKTKETNKKEKKWKKGVIPYYISNDFTSMEKETIKEAISLMNYRLTRVKIRPYNDDKNYVYIFSGKGCYSKLGMIGGPQPLSLQSGKCLKTGIIQHELMHAVGFSHEQNRPDRNEYIELLYNNIPDKWLKQYERKNPKEAAYVGKYDYLSAMHYPPDAPGNPEEYAFKVLDLSINLKDIGNRPELSDLDVRKIEEFYS